MSSWSISTTAPAAWSELCGQSNSLFYSEEWMTLLERSFGCSSLYFLCNDHQQGVAISQFRAGPFRIGYLGFPIGGIMGNGLPGRDILDVLRQASDFQLPVAIRIPVSSLGNAVELDLPYEPTAETAIVDLQSWSLEQATTNRKRDVKRSSRSSLRLEDANDPASAERIYELYRETIKRNDGALRYNLAYFRELICLAQRNPRLRVVLARQDAMIAGFTVAAMHGAVAYYLHGAFDWSLRQDRPAALLMNEVIDWAQSQGCGSFNFLSSPPGQESLIKYKEGWGAQTREHRTYTLQVKSTYFLFKVAERLYRVFR